MRMHIPIFCNASEYTSAAINDGDTSAGRDSAAIIYVSNDISAGAAIDGNS